MHFCRVVVWQRRLAHSVKIIVTGHHSRGDVITWIFVIPRSAVSLSALGSRLNYTAGSVRPRAADGGYRRRLSSGPDSTHGTS